MSIFLLVIRDFQKEMNDYFTDPGTSPLPEGTIVDFKGSAFFPVDEQYRVMAYLERLPEQDFFLMPTTTEHRVTQRVYGRVHFRLRQQDLVLPVYQDPSHLETTDLKALHDREPARERPPDGDDAAATRDAPGPGEG